jgi:dUTP pyrophosphatase
MIGSPAPLVSQFVDLDEQLQPNGVDLTLESIAAFRGAGRLGRTNDDRILPDTGEIAFGADGYAHLDPGVYMARLNEVVSLPDSVMAIAKPRSSLLRSGVAVNNAVWDAGYTGRSQVQIVVHNPAGFTLARDARIIQMVFMTLDTATQQLYQGQYQSEGTTPPDRQPG